MRDPELTAESRALRRFLRLFALAACVTGGSYLVVAIPLGSVPLAVTGAATSALAVASVIATRLARGGREQLAVELVVYSLLAAVAVAVVNVGFAYATLVLVCTFAAGVAIAFLEPRRTRPVILASLVVALFCVVMGLWLGPRTTLPVAARDALVVLTVVVLVYLVGLVMSQLRQRLTGTLHAQQLAAQQLEEAYRSLETAYARAREADRRKDDFLAMLGHELRNPLSPIVTALDLMRETCEGRADREREIIERQVLHLSRLVDDLLDISRITSRKLALHRRNVQLAAVVREAVETAAPLLAEREQSLTVEVPERGLLVHADPTRLAQIVTNLLRNAAKYTQPGGHVTVRAERVDARARLDVRDDGVGMSPELLARIFEPFVQGRESAEQRRGGLGLGLALARELTEMHGGHIEATSKGPGRGSCVSVTLPVVQEAVAAEPEPAPPHTGNGRSRRVLVVDDNADAAELLALALSRRGFDARVAHDGPEALRVAAESPPDVAVLDIGLPVMDGYELAARMRAQLGDRPLTLIALTGYGQPSDRERTMQAGFSVHLVKPIDLPQLERCLSQAP